MNDFTSIIYDYVDWHDHSIESACAWSDEALRKLIDAAETEIKRRAQSEGEDVG